MRTYAEMDRLHRLARPLYLELRALGLDVIAYEEDAPSGYRIEIIGGESLSPAHVDKLQRRVDEATPGLLRVLWARWDENLTAVRKEAGS